MSEARPLRPYQRELVRSVSAAYAGQKKAVLMQSATGSGKTRTATYIVEKYVSTGRQVLWLVHREELLMQAAMTFAEQGIPHKLICATSSERAIKAQQFREYKRSYIENGAKVVIASIQTLVRRLDKLDWLTPSQIIADECHLSLAVTWRRVLDFWPEARLLGLTATPWRLDKQSFDRADGGLYDTITCGPKVADLMAWGNLAKYKLFAPPIEMRKDVEVKHQSTGDYRPEDLAAELDAPVIYGDVVKHYRDICHGMPAIAFCPTVASAEKFAKAFRDAGYRAIALDGETDDAIRRRSLQQLGAGEIDVVTSVSILVEGTDVPFATVALMLRKTESLSLYLQAVGRVLRPHEKKPHAYILDFVGVTDIHGYPDDDREWTLAGPERKRTRKADNDNEPDVLVQKCPKCFAAHKPAAVCPGCGYEYPARERKEMKQVEGTLQEVTDEEKALKRKQQMLMQGRAQTVEELVSQGMKQSQAIKIIAARAEKARLRQEIVDGIDLHRVNTGMTGWQAFGVGTSDILKMKPKELKALLARINENNSTTSVAM